MSSDPNPSNSSSSQKLNVFVSLVNRLRLLVRLMRDPRVPIYLKFIPFASLLYVLLPIDLIPDLLPVLGQLDDLGIVLLATEAFVMMSPQDVVAQHQADIEARANPSAQDTVIDGEWRRVNHDR
jgi:uncharacterized membrane protein YkvA (DUF1232 family)